MNCRKRCWFSYFRLNSCFGSKPVSRLRRSRFFSLSALSLWRSRSRDSDTQMNFCTQPPTPPIATNPVVVLSKRDVVLSKRDAHSVASNDAKKIKRNRKTSCGKTAHNNTAEPLYALIHIFYHNVSKTTYANVLHVWICNDAKFRS